MYIYMHRLLFAFVICHASCLMTHVSFLNSYVSFLTAHVSCLVCHFQFNISLCVFCDLHVVARIYNVDCSVSISHCAL